RSYGDWSSDVCSSDLAVAGKIRAGLMELMKDKGGGGGAVVDAGPMSKAIQERMPWERRGTPEQPSFSWSGHVLTFVRLEGAVDEIGRASCREGGGEGV